MNVFILFQVELIGGVEDHRSIVGIYSSEKKAEEKRKDYDPDDGYFNYEIEKHGVDD